MKIYTKTGDKGLTSLANGHRVSKNDLRLESYGTADELNSWVGLLRSRIGSDRQEQMQWIQNKLFNLGALLAGAEGDEWITNRDVQQIETWIDTIQAQLEPLKAFILPGGNETISTCHICRTITRRLERQMVKLFQTQTINHSDICLQWVNRLSDFWFVLARNIAQDEKIDIFLWKK